MQQSIMYVHFKFASYMDVLYPGIRIRNGLKSRSRIRRIWTKLFRIPNTG